MTPLDVHDLLREVFSGPLAAVGIAWVGTAFLFLLKYL